MSQTSIVKNRPGHPGKGRKKSRRTPKGRQPRPEAVTFVESLLGAKPLRRDLLIEYLHRIQDACGYLSADNIAALAHLMKLAQTEVYEVATFYAHFDVIGDHDKPPPAVTLRVCDSIVCQLAGAADLQAALAKGLAAEDIRVIAAPCMGRCDQAPVTVLGQHHIAGATPEKIHSALAAKQFHPVLPEQTTGFEEYRAQGGYQMLKRLLDGSLGADDILTELDASALRGLGGAGFPTGRKLRIVRDYPGPRLMAVNADEGEPGTFKDRYYLGTDPHRFIEGMLIA
ncbi:MAG: NAD(P)H-dependent oxidoreductase subunit E, partial [Gammaproteobacteria bacterium]|nr:NAD(P)H-dependent oxidoreductase subunit E [Gammaproteobacteria bacterium]